MAITIDGGYAPDQLKMLPCGGTPIFDYASGCAYRCDTCNAVIGSVGMPRECYETYKNDTPHNDRLNRIRV